MRSNILNNIYLMVLMVLKNFKSGIKGFFIKWHI